MDLINSITALIEATDSAEDRVLLEQYRSELERNFADNGSDPYTNPALVISKLDNLIAAINVNGLDSSASSVGSATEATLLSIRASLIAQNPITAINQLRTELLAKLEDTKPIPQVSVPDPELVTFTASASTSGIQTTEATGLIPAPVAGKRIILVYLMVQGKSDISGEVTFRAGALGDAVFRVICGEVIGAGFAGQLNIPLPESTALVPELSADIGVNINGVYYLEDV